MLKSIFFGFTILTLISCQTTVLVPSPATAPPTLHATVAQNVLPSPVPSRVVAVPVATPLTRQPAPYLIVAWAWYMDTQPVLTLKNFEFGVHAVEFTHQETIVIYSASGKRVRKLLTDKKTKMVDDLGGSYRLVRQTKLAQFNKIEIGALIFEPRQSGTTTLGLEFQPSKKKESWKLHVARQYDAPEKADFVTSYHAAAYREEYFDQAGARISFNGWYLQKEDRVAKTQKPGMTDEESIAYSATRAAEFDALELSDAELKANTPEGVRLAQANGIRTEMTLRVETLKSQHLRYVYVVIDGAGQVHASVLE